MNQIFQKRVVPVVVLDRAEDAVPLAEALCRAGLPVIEVTFRTAAAAGAIALIRKAVPAMTVGAGTLLETMQVDEAVRAGAQFGVSPGLNETVVKHAQQAGLPFIPGVMTPSDVEHAVALGCKVLKFFPAEAAGGVKMLSALAGPYVHTGVKFIPLGGLSAASAASYLKLPVVAAIGGSWMVERKLIAEKQWAQITALTAEAVKLAAAAS
jgi:2-dehydro-3-deoxyphosphogluconate aldolase/(4S)-4-hydroxy-2-oxoglutarate aldolase